MSNRDPHQVGYSARSVWQQSRARKRLYARRRIGALAVLLLLLGGLGYGGYRLRSWWQARSATEASLPATTQPSLPAAEPQPQPPRAGQAQPQAAGLLPFTVDSYLRGPDLDGDGREERVAVGRSEAGMRPIALVRGPEGGEQLIGTPLTVPDGKLAVADLPRAPRTLVWQGSLPRSGDPVPVKVGGAEARLASGGEPDWKAWTLDPNRGLVVADYYALVAPVTPPEPTLVLVDKGLNVLWYFENRQLVQTARVATGKYLSGPAPSAANQKENHLTPQGRFTVTLRMPGVTYFQTKIPARAPENPLGTRWLGFSAFAGDNGTIWAVHGTNDPSRLGRWVTEGSVEMRNGELEQLYDRVKLGTPIVIQSSTGQ